MKPNLENIKEYTNKVSLTSEEKFDMFQNIRNYTQQNPIKPKYSLFMKHSVVYASMLALIIGTTATSLAAEEALPGDVLYPIKTEVNEVIVKSLSITKKQKANTAINLVNKRMSELTELVVTDQDNSENISLIASKLEEHRTDFEEIMRRDTVLEADTSEDSKIYDTLESVIESHLDILEEITEDKKQDESEQVQTEDEQENEIEGDEEIKTDETVVVDAEPVVETAFQLTINSSTEENITLSEDVALQELVNFSNKVAPLLLESKSKNTNTTSSEQIKKEVRDKIIEDAEEELEIDIKINNTEDSDLDE